MLTIYALSMYTCVTVNDFTGSLMSKTCTWHQNGSLYRTEAACAKAGKAEIGHPYFTDVADGAVYENYRCYPTSVSE